MHSNGRRRRKIIPSLNNLSRPEEESQRVRMWRNVKGDWPRTKQCTAEVDIEDLSEQAGQFGKHLRIKKKVRVRMT